MHTKSDLISVIMPVFNPNPNFLYSAVSSILDQTYGHLELIIVDDSSDPAIWDLLDSMSNKDRRIVYIRPKLRIGYVKSLNLALSKSRGEFIARMDADDIAEPNRLESLSRFLKENRSVKIVGSAIRKIGAEGEDLGVRHYPTHPQDVEKQMGLWNTIANPTVMFYKNVIDRIGPYNERVEVEDYEFWLRAISSGVKIANVENPLIRYRVPSGDHNSMRGRHWKNNLELKFKYFNFRHPIFGILGILCVSLALLCPRQLEGYCYRAFNSWR